MVAQARRASGREEGGGVSVFNGSRGRKPQTEARRYVYGCIASALDNGDEQTCGWFGPTEDMDEFDRRRLKKAVAAVYKEMVRKRASQSATKGCER
jgi:hypothetical protein